MVDSEDDLFCDHATFQASDPSLDIMSSTSGTQPDINKLRFTKSRVNEGVPRSDIRSMFMPTGYSQNHTRNDIHCDRSAGFSARGSRLEAVKSRESTSCITEIILAFKKAEIELSLSNTDLVPRELKMLRDTYRKFMIKNMRKVFSKGNIKSSKRCHRADSTDIFGDISSLSSNNESPKTNRNKKNNNVSKCGPIKSKASYSRPVRENNTYKNISKKSNLHVFENFSTIHEEGSKNLVDNHQPALENAINNKNVTIHEEGSENLVDNHQPALENAINNKNVTIHEEGSENLVDNHQPALENAINNKNVTIHEEGSENLVDNHQPALENAINNKNVTIHEEGSENLVDNHQPALENAINNKNVGNKTNSVEIISNTLINTTLSGVKRIREDEDISMPKKKRKISQTHSDVPTVKKNDFILAKSKLPVRENAQSESHKTSRNSKAEESAQRSIPSHNVISSEQISTNGNGLISTISKENEGRLDERIKGNPRVLLERIDITSYLIYNASQGTYSFCANKTVSVPYTPSKNDRKQKSSIESVSTNKKGKWQNSGDK